MFKKSVTGNFRKEPISDNLTSPDSEEYLGTCQSNIKSKIVDLILMQCDVMTNRNYYAYQLVIPWDVFVSSLDQRDWLKHVKISI